MNTKELFCSTGDIILFTLKFYNPDQVEENRSTFRLLHYLNALLRTISVL